MMELNEQIGSYLRDELPPEEVVRLEERMKKDSEFRLEVEAQRRLFEAMQEEDVMDFRALLTEVQADQETPRILRRRLPTWVYAAAAGVALLIVAGILLFNNQSSSPEELFAEHYQAFPLLSIERGDTTDIAESWETAYLNKEYATALPSLTSMSAQFPDSTQLILFRSNCLLSTNQANAAIPLLQEILSQHTNFQEEARWYLALAFLRTNDLSAAKQLLEKIANRNTPTYNQAKAKEILEDWK